jgi:hypothetical protein
MGSHLDEVYLRTMCRVLGVHRGGYYAWQRERPVRVRGRMIGCQV